MGNTSSDITENIKAQADAQESPAYKLINVKGSGELVAIMKAAKMSKDLKNIDEEIRRHVVEFLFNEGQGKLISIQDLVRNRSSNKKKNQMNPFTSKMEALLVHELNTRFHSYIFKAKIDFNNESNFKNVCWDIRKRGAVGETALHICLLNASPLYNDLAKRLVRIFPNLVNDIYLSDEYYGETALHLAIVNEDASMVKFLLIYGADVHQRCCGKFFCPDDQKDKRQDSITQECPILPVNTNYYGLSYFGEYPLSFAAVMNQEDCIRLLMAKGADPNKQDSNGNTVLHMLVIHDKLTMFSLILDFGARLDIKNRQGLTPLTLSARLARKEVFKFIVERIRNIYWVYGDISCAAYPLTDIDSISFDGSTNPNSALYSIVNGGSQDHLDLMEGLIIDLLQEKWKTYVKKKFYFELFIFFTYFAFSSVTIILQRYYFVYLKQNTNCTDNTTNNTQLLDHCKCAYLKPIDPNGHVRVRNIFECIVVIFALGYIVMAILELYTEKYKLFFHSLFDNPIRFSFLISCFLVLLIVPIRITCYPVVEDYLLVICCTLISFYFLYFCRGFRVIGPFVLMILKMIKGDLMRFFLIYSVFLMGFSQAMYMVFNFGTSTNENIFQSPIGAMFDLFVISLGNFDEFYYLLEKATYSRIGKLLFVIYLIIVCILLINILIAMMTNTYATIIETKREWQRQWAKIILTIEQSFFPQRRLDFQKRYSHLMKNCERALVVLWKQSVEERAELMAQKEAFRHQTRETMFKKNLILNRRAII